MVSIVSIIDGGVLWVQEQEHYGGLLYAKRKQNQRRQRGQNQRRRRMCSLTGLYKILSCTKVQGLVGTKELAFPLYSLSSVQEG